MLRPLAGISGVEIIPATGEREAIDKSIAFSLQAVLRTCEGPVAEDVFMGGIVKRTLAFEPAIATVLPCCSAGGRPVN